MSYCCQHVVRGCRCSSPVKDDPRPIDVRCDRPVRTLNDTVALGLAGLAAIFTDGSYWEVGPFVAGRDPEVVQVVGAPYTSGYNYSTQPDAIHAKGKKAWFIATRRIWSPHESRGSGEPGGQPPIVLCGLTPRMAAIAGVACCDCAVYVPPCRERILSCSAGVLTSLRAEIEALTEDLQTAHRRADNAEALMRESQRKLEKVKAALR